jgi:hypothetical protein
MSEDIRFGRLRELAQEIEEAIYEGLLRTHIGCPEESTEAELLERLEAIQQLLIYLNGVRLIQSDCFQGHETVETAMHALETIRYQSMAITRA